MVYSRYTGSEVTIGDAEHILMKEADVVGIKGSSVAEMKPLQASGRAGRDGCCVGFMRKGRRWSRCRAAV